MIGKALTKVFGSKNERVLKQMSSVVTRINELEPETATLTDAQLGARTEVYKDRYSRGESLDELLPEAFATIREASKRVLGERHFDVQLLGGMVLHQGNIAEMKT
ncbi:MAG TPA: preprotein translocase subunit SecA, partial [Desulfofustis sp.]|nr:preprotein translocase subunit SecA [Desulfofustis sp.]